MNTADTCKTCKAEIEFENGQWFHSRIEAGDHEPEPA